MRSTALLAVALALAAAAAACKRDAPPPEAGGAAPRVDVALEGETMGSTWHVKINAPQSRVVEAEAMQAPIDATLERINDEMSTYRPNSEISRFNASRSTAPFPVSHELAVVVQKSIEVGHATDGAYDITIDPLINAWGFDRLGRRESPPSAEEIAAAKKHTGLALISVAGDTIAKSDPDARINLGGIAAGYAVDVVAAQLADEGFHDVMVEITGELLARGKNASGQPWKIGVETPDENSDDIVTAVPVVDQSLTTSGSYHNFFESDGKRYSHIIDPKSGAPVQTDLVSVTVMYKDAVTADGFDTPFIILGEERARQIIAAHPGMEALFIHRNADHTWRITSTPGFPLPAAAPRVQYGRAP